MTIALGSACTRPPANGVVWRLTDSPGQTDGTPLEPDPEHHSRGRSRATINDDQRYTFEPPESAPVIRGLHTDVWVYATPIDVVPTSVETFTTPVWGNPTIVARSDGEHPAPWNVLLLSIDTLRAGSMSAYGNPRQTPPTIDWLASQGALFEKTIAPSTTTPQSHMSMMTGLLPSAHGNTDLTRGSDLTAYATLAEKLQLAGYVTGAVTEDGMLRAAVGFERGFDSYAENKASESTGNVGLIETTFAQAREWLGRRGTAPFFLFVHTYQVHDPYRSVPTSA